jgi:hypothetical protein
LRESKNQNIIFLAFIQLYASLLAEKGVTKVFIRNVLQTYD